MDDLALKALATTRALAALGIESFEAAGATFVRDRKVPRLVQSNYVTNVEVSTTKEIDVLIERLEVEYADAQHRRFEVDFTTPAEFEARLACEDYAVSTSLIMVLEGDLAATPPVYDMRPVDNVEAWSIMAEFKRRGIATALVHHCVADARACGAGPVVAVTDAADTPKHMYAAMGFRPVAILRDYLKTI